MPVLLPEHDCDNLESLCLTTWRLMGDLSASMEIPAIYGAQRAICTTQSGIFIVWHSGRKNDGLHPST